MKTKDLINLLETLDPTGNLEVTVGNVDIVSIEKKPAFRDGFQEIVEYSSDTTGERHINRVIFQELGDKICLTTLSCRDILEHFDPSVPISMSLIRTSQSKIEESVAKWRENGRSRIRKAV